MMDIVKTLRSVDPVGLKAALARRDREGEAAVTGRPAAPDIQAEKPAIDFTREGPAETQQRRAKKAARLSDLLRARDAEDAKYADAWKEGEK